MRSAIVRVRRPLDVPGRGGAVDDARDVAGALGELRTQVDGAEPVVVSQVEPDEQIGGRAVDVVRIDGFAVDRGAEGDVGSEERTAGAESVGIERHDAEDSGLDNS